MRSLLAVALVVFAGMFVLPAAGIAGPPAAEYIVVVRDGVDARAVAARDTQRYGAAVTFRYSHALNGYAAMLTSSGRAGVEADPDVVSVSQSRILVATVKDPFLPPPNPQPAQALSNGLNRIDAEQSSTASGDGVGLDPINVAVLDSGIDTQHPDLNVPGGVDCAPGNGIEDTNGHGTFVAGLIGARDNAIGRAGVVPDARLWSVRVLDRNLAGNDTHIICGIDWVTATRTDADPTNDIAVANIESRGLSVRVIITVGVLRTKIRCTERFVDQLLPESPMSSRP